MTSVGIAEYRPVIVHIVLLCAFLGTSSSSARVISIRRARIHVGDDHNLSDAPTKCVIDYSASAREKAMARPVKGINRNP